ncbi:MAG: type VI secretion system baseplate subunit TssG [Planctomycetaceae bacterium]
MDGSSGRKAPDLIDELFSHPHQFGFFQAVRLLERAAVESAGARPPARIGGDGPVSDEIIRFRAIPSLSFPPGEISSLKQIEPDHRFRRGELMVAFMGLTGPSGVLPQHYTSLLIERCHVRHKDHTLREFFDLFNHRAISLYYRAWEKYRFPILYERQETEGTVDEDLFTSCLLSLTGLGIRAVQDRMRVHDHVTLLFGGLFANQTRSAKSLEQIILSYFSIPAEVIQFFGQWLYLPVEAQTKMPSANDRLGRNLALGQNAVAGSRVWDVQSRVRIRLGPLPWATFIQLMPDGKFLPGIAALIRFYVGPTLDFDVQLVLRASDVPACQLGGEGSQAPRLGWTTWMGSKRRTQDADDAVFAFTQ